VTDRQDGPIASLAFSPDAGQPAAGQFGGRVAIWRMHGALEQTFAVPTSQDVTFSPDGRRIAANNWDGSVNIWDAGTRD